MSSREHVSLLDRVDVVGSNPAIRKRFLTTAKEKLKRYCRETLRYNVTEQAVLAALLRAMNGETLRCHPSLETVAESAGCSVSSVARAIRRFSGGKSGDGDQVLIKRRRAARRKGYSNAYEFRFELVDCFAIYAGRPQGDPWIKPRKAEPTRGPRGRFGVAAAAPVGAVDACDRSELSENPTPDAVVPLAQEQLWEAAAALDAALQPLVPVPKFRTWSNANHYLKAHGARLFALSSADGLKYARGYVGLGDVDYFRREYEKCSRG